MNEARSKAQKLRRAEERERRYQESKRDLIVNAEFRRAQQQTTEKKRLAESYEEFGWLIFIGEVSPGKDASNLTESLASAILFAHAFGDKDPVVVGQTTLFEVEERNWAAAVASRRFFVNPISLELGGYRFEKEFVEANEDDFEKHWIVFEGSHEPITQAELDAAMRLLGESFQQEKPEPITERPEPIPAPQLTEIQRFEQRIHDKGGIMAFFSATSGIGEV